MNPEDLIRRVRLSVKGRDEVINELYRNDKLRSNSLKFILSHGGTRDDADSIFCDTIINFTKNCLSEKFKIHSTIENYFFGVTKNLWYKRTKSTKLTQGLDQVKDHYSDESPEIILIDEERRHLLEEILSKLDPKCRKVLALWASDLKMQKIAETMNYSSSEVVRKKKHFCLKKLIDLAKLHPEILDSLKN